MSTQRTRVLIEANRTASTPRLIEAVRLRRRSRAVRVRAPDSRRADRKAADWTLDTALLCCAPPRAAPSKGS